MHAKVILRKQRYIVYLKDSEEIIQILNVMEAHRSLMELENIRIIKDMRNSANRSQTVILLILTKWFGQQPDRWMISDT